MFKLIKNGYSYFGAGGALGFDTIATQTVLHLKERYPHTKLILVLPCIDQANITEIATKVGFTSFRSFNRNFLKIMKTTPSEYRLSNK